VELQLNRSQSNCCGAGGGLEATNPALVMEASQGVIGMARDVAAEVLITACPTCKHSFWRHTYQDDGLETRDVVELVALAMGVNGTEA
jgi:Fe-S oxidoreductase